MPSSKAAAMRNRRRTLRSTLRISMSRERSWRPFSAACLQGARMIPKDLRYHQEHEWVRVSGTQATLGISHFAQDALGDIVFIDTPKLGDVVKAGQQIGEVEST